MHGTSIILAIQDCIRIIDLLQVIPTPVTFFYLHHWVVLYDLFTLDFERRRDFWDLARRRCRYFCRWRGMRLI